MERATLFVVRLLGSTWLRRCWKVPLWACASVALAGCSATDGKVDDDGVVIPDKESVAFDEKGTLELAPSELRTLHLKTKPGAIVRLLLIGESGDGSLDRGEVAAGDDGAASVVLKAPSKPGAFHVLASVGENASADLAIAVSELGFARVQVKPTYSGIRDVVEWSASVSVGVDCAAALSAYPGDPVGSLKAKSSADAFPEIASVPVGPKLAIVAHSGAIIWGCVEGKLDMPNTETTSTLEVTDVPLSLGAAKLDLALAFAPTSVEYGLLVQTASAHLVAAAFPVASESASLLDAMRDLCPSDALVDFDEHRASVGLDASVDAILAAHSGRAAMEDWVGLVLDGSPTGPAPELSISGALVGNAENPLAPSFRIDALGPVSGVVAGAPSELALSWKGEPSDTIVAGGTIVFSPTRFVGALLSTESVAADPSAADGGDALANAMDCASIATITAFNGCDEACSEALCRTAVATMWQRGLAADDGLGALDVAVSGTAKVDESAVPIAVAGSWVGSMAAPGASCALGGPAVATTPPPP